MLVHRPDRSTVIFRMDIIVVVVCNRMFRTLVASYVQYVS